LPVPVLLAELLRLRNHERILVFGALLDVALRTRQRPEQIHFGHQLFSSISRCTRATPSSSGMKRMSGNALTELATSQCRRVIGLARGVFTISTLLPN